jgi:broad specificity polyphosphatase/5'/3'-nucleotidase SurE
MTKMLNVNIDTNGINQQEAQDWTAELANVYADMEIEDVNISGNKISFKAGFSGMEDTEPDDIQMKIEEYISMNEAFQVKNLSIK